MMKQSLTARTNLFISLIIIAGFALVSLVNYITYSNVIKDDIENISKLSSTNIYASINNELTKPIFVSLTMANDSFLKNWLNQEMLGQNDDVRLKEIQEYLLGIKGKYGYSSVFLISEATKKYYYYQGINKVISPQDEHDQWYYSFVDKGISYALDVDQDQVANNELTVFVNCRVVGSSGNLLGVVGVGLKMDEIQSLFHIFESEYDLNAFLISPEGVVQAHTDSRKIETVNIFDNASITNLKEVILSNKDSIQSFPYKQKDWDGYIITRYIEELGWYLVVEKDISVLSTALKAQLMNDILIAVFVLALLLFLSTRLISRYKAKVVQIARTDELTQLPNRRAFDQSIDEALKYASKNNKPVCVFIFDIDEFKKVNDHFGHMRGDKVIAQIAQMSKLRLGESVLFARWGGDEFAGILYEELDVAENILSDLLREIANLKNISEFPITISIGLTKFNPFDTSDTIIIRADNALYKAKATGRNKVFIIK
ncbi:MAG: GGDEF domain-containing protein [Clostridia bacterium]|nr:GGDEF domain-containing protein [Clostridia bacterium]